MKLFSSTKIRLTFWYSGVLALILTLFALVSYFLFSYALQSQIDQTLNEISNAFVTSVAQELEDETITDRDAAITNEIRDAIVETNFKSYRIFVFSGEKNLIAETKSHDNETAFDYLTAQNWLNEFDENPKNFNVGARLARGFFKPFEIEGRKFFLIVSHPLEAQEELLAKIRYAFLLIVPLSLIFATFGGYLLARKSLAPISEMSEKAEEITAQNLHERLPVENKEDELGRLAATFNNLLARLDASFEQQKRFMADASHELRTPVAIVRGEADVSLTKNEREPSEYKETIKIIQSESERMSRIIEDLFTLARADSGENAPQKSETYINDILAETVKSFRTLAQKNAINISFKSADEMPINADEQLLRRLFTNLIDNAVKFAKTYVNIEAKLNKGFYEIIISDDGEGISLENQTHIFERFYRAEKARSRQKPTNAGSGAGLGLSISQWITEIHQGTLELVKSDAEGTTFSVRFPASK
jgi:heavy metal sensor kinase